MSRGSHISGSPAEYTKSPLARFWAEAEDSRVDASEKIAHIREERFKAKEGSAWNRWRPRRGGS